MWRGSVRMSRTDAQRIFGGLRQDGERIGDPNAPVSIQFFTDLQCAPCAPQFFETVPTLVEKYVRSGKANLIYRHYSFSRNAIQEGFIAAEAAGEQGYQWHYAYTFFASQDEAKRLGIDEDFLSAIAVSTGELELARWREDYEAGHGEDSALTKRLLRQDEIARGLGLRNQPSVIVSGPGGTETLQDSPGLEEIEAAVERVSGDPEA